MVSGRADDKNLALNADIDSTISMVADRRAVKQIIVNLLSNAVKFTPDGGKVVVRSRLLREFHRADDRRHRHRDRPAFAARLGRPFEQVESQLTKTYHGSGLGLAIARSLTDLHGGSMKLRSKLGTGTVVCVSLPRDAARPGRKCRWRLNVFSGAGAHASNASPLAMLLRMRNSASSCEAVARRASRTMKPVPSKWDRAAFSSVPRQYRRTPASLGLGLLDPRLERGKVRGVAGPRQHPQQVVA